MCVDPAHAGMILTDDTKENNPKGGPRACGDDPGRRGAKDSSLTWTPRMRG